MVTGLLQLGVARRLLNNQLLIVCKAANDSCKPRKICQDIRRPGSIPLLFAYRAKDCQNSSPAWLHVLCLFRRFGTWTPESNNPTKPACVSDWVWTSARSSRPRVNRWRIGSGIPFNASNTPGSQDRFLAWAVLQKMLAPVPTLNFRHDAVQLNLLPSTESHYTTRRCAEVRQTDR